MQTESFHPKAITVGEGRRALNDETVKRLAESIKSIGLRTPLTVLDADGGKTITLVTGHHRLAAVKSLGWKDVPCFVIENDKLDAEMWEISENLHRAELTALERDEQVSRWIELSEARVSLQSATKPQVGRPESGKRKAARELGIETTDAHRATKVAGLTDEAKQAAVEAGLDDNRSALLEASRQEPAAQVTRLREIADAKANKVEADVKSRAAKEVAEIISEYVPADAWDMLKANLYAAGARNIANSLTNITGNSVMDKAGWGN